MGSRLKDDQYITIPSIARTRFNLKGNELLVFGVIHGLTQHREWCTCSQQYICEWIGTSDTKSVRRVLERLVEIGAIEKCDFYENNVKFCKYRVKCPYPGQIDPTPPVKLPSNIILEKELPLNIDESIYPPTQEKPKRKVFSKPSIKEIEIYCKERNNGIDAEDFFYFYETRGWMVGKSPMKDWHAAIRTWELRRNKDATAKAEAESNAHVY